MPETSDFTEIPAAGPQTTEPKQDIDHYDVEKATDDTFVEAPIDEKGGEQEAEPPEATDAESGKQSDQKPPTVEEIAREMGWKGKEDYYGHPDDFVDPATFIRRERDISETLRRHLKDTKRERADLQETIKTMKAFHENLKKSQRVTAKKELEKLRAERLDAIEEGDAERVDKVEQDMSRIYGENLKEEAPPEREEDREAMLERIETFRKWHKENTWFHVEDVVDGDRELSDYADFLSEQPEYASLPYAKRLQRVGEVVRRHFPEKFNKQGPKSNSVESPTSTRQKRQFSERDLTKEQRDIMNTMVSNGHITKAQYIKQLAAIGEIA